jgi:plasmid maintenance system antidote protein VapI
MALRIGRFAGNGPWIWLRMQQAYDLWVAENRMADELSRIEPVVSENAVAMEVVEKYPQQKQPG